MRVDIGSFGVSSTNRSSGLLQL